MENPPRDFDQQHPPPRGQGEDPAAVELIVGSAHELVQVLDRVRRQLIGVGQSQIGTGGPVEPGKPGDGLGAQRLFRLALHLGAQLLQLLPIAAPRLE